MTTHLIGFTGAPEEFVVPGGVTTIDVNLVGAATGGLNLLGIPVTAGESLWFYIGGLPNAGLGGWNGGADGTLVGILDTAGCGASDIRQGGMSLAERIAVAGGRGGYNVTEGPGGITNFGRESDNSGTPIYGPQPGSTDPPRVPFIPGPGDVTLTGDAGGFWDGSIGGVLLLDGDVAYGSSGGGGWGGGAAASIDGTSTLTTPAWDFQGGRAGGNYAAPGISAADLGLPDTDHDGWALITWTARRGWSVGHLAY